MDTLYDLLGALPHDDAEGLRTAFRKAVKGAHPDLRPGDPEAAIKFRQIVRANDILLDKDQRAVYDHLLVLAQQEKNPAAAHPIAARIHRIASGVLAFASVSVVTVGGYLVFMHMSVALVAPTGGLAASHASVASMASMGSVASIAPVDLTARLTASIAAVSPADAPDPAAVNAFIVARTEGTGTASVANAMAMAPVVAETDNTSSSDAPAAQTADPANVLHVSAAGAAAIEADQVTHLETRFTAPYVDRGLLFFRDKSDDHAFPDLTPLKRAEKPGRAKSVVAANSKAHAAETLPKTVPLPVPRTIPRTVPRFVSQQPWYASASFQ